MKDFVGKELRINDIVAYSVTREKGLKKGRIVSLNGKIVTVQYDYSSQERTIHRTRKVNAMDVVVIRRRRNA